MKRTWKNFLSIIFYGKLQFFYLFYLLFFNLQPQWARRAAAPSLASIYLWKWPLSEKKKILGVDNLEKTLLIS
jgi:hypothetical protein